MPKLHLLPLGTVIDGKASSPGWEQLRFMVTGYFPVVKDTGVHFDYTVTPWPLGYVNIDDGTQKMFYSCNEEAIGTVDFLGAVDECAEENVDWVYAEARRREDVKTPLAQGAEPMMHAYGDLPCTVAALPFSEDEVLPLGTVVSTARNAARKGMIYQHGATVLKAILASHWELTAALVLVFVATEAFMLRQTWENLPDGPDLAMGVCCLIGSILFPVLLVICAVGAIRQMEQDQQRRLMRKAKQDDENNQPRLKS